jgi:hypothetical protein
MPPRLPVHPFERWPRRHRRLLLWVVSVLSAIAIALVPMLKLLREDTHGFDIVDFEFAGTAVRAAEILAAWQLAGVVPMAKVIQLFDIVYPALYGSALAGCCLAAGHALLKVGRTRFANASRAMAWLAFVAAAFDYVENIGLDIALWYRPTDPLLLVSAVAAGLKFSAIVVTFLYAIVGFGLAAVPRLLRR